MLCDIEDVVSSLSFNEDGSLLASGDRGGWVTLYDVDGLPKKVCDSERGIRATNSRIELRSWGLVTCPQCVSEASQYSLLLSIDVGSR